MALSRGEYSERTAEVIDQEVCGLLLVSAERVRKTSASHRTELQTLAKELLHHEVVDRQTLTKLLQAAAVELPHVVNAYSHVA